MEESESSYRVVDCTWEELLPHGPGRYIEASGGIWKLIRKNLAEDEEHFDGSLIDGSS